MEPGHSINAMLVGDDGVAKVQAAQFEKQNSARFSGTKLVCCQGPDVPCPKNTFKQLRWMDGVAGALPIKSFTRKVRGKDRWYCFVLKDTRNETVEGFETKLERNPSLNLSNWGFVLSEGEGKQMPPNIEETIVQWTTFAELTL